MRTTSYDPNEASVKERCHVIELYSNANTLRHSPSEFFQARQKADDAITAWLDKYGPSTRQQTGA